MGSSSSLAISDDESVLIADLCRVGSVDWALVTRMHPHRKLQMCHSTEPLLANSALVRFLSRVHQAVVLQFGQILETLLTILAFVNYLSVLPLQCVRYRSNSVALAPRRRTAGADGR